MSRSYVVTGGGRGVGRAVVERLAADGAGVVVIELDPATLGWVEGHPARQPVLGVVGSAGDQDVAERAADHAQALGLLAGWANNAAVFRDAGLDTAPGSEVLDLITANLAPAVIGCATAVHRFLTARSLRVDRHQPPATRRSVPCAGPCPTPSPQRRSRD